MQRPGALFHLVSSDVLCIHHVFLLRTFVDLAPTSGPATPIFEMKELTDTPTR